MPEGDTIARAAATLHAALAGHRVTAFSAALAGLAAAADAHKVPGRVVEGVSARGKHLLIRFSDDLVLRTHLRMHGAWHLYRPGERWRRAATAMRVRVDTPAWVAVAFDVYDAELVATDASLAVPALATLGPDLLDPHIDVAGAAARLRRATGRTIGDVLLDQRVVAGLGNVLRAEVLFLTGLHPGATAAHLSPADAEQLIGHAIRLLRVNARPGAGPRRTTGLLSPNQRLWVYRRRGLPCRRCATPIESEQRSPDGRRVYWCPKCQPTPAE